MAVDVTKVSELEVEPGELPETMAAWVIREEREGEPKDAFQLEEIEVPEPGAFEVIVRVMAAGVNYNNVWAALGKPVSVMKYGDHPQYGHHIGGSDASGVVWKVGEGVTRWKPGDEVVVHCNIASYEDPEVHGLDPLAAPSQMIWGYETTWGSFAQFTKVQAQQLLPKPQGLTWDEASSYGLVYFTAYRMLITRCGIQAGDRVLIWGAAGGLGVFATQICALAGAHAVGVVSSPEKGELVKQLGAVDYIDRNEFNGMMRTGGETPDEEKARFKVSREFSKRVKGILGDAPDIVFEHVGQATFPTSVFTVKPFGKVVICAGTTGYNLDFDVRYLWMRQKEILGSHFANAYECNKANELIESGQIRPVLWRTLGFEGVPARRVRGRRPTDRARSARRWAHDSGAYSLGGQPVPRRCVRRGLASGRRAGPGLRRHGVVVHTRRRGAARLRADRELPVQGALRALLVLGADVRDPDGAVGLLPGADPAHLLGGSGRRRGRHPCSSGAIVSPASFSCSQ
jgi:crotonyl-CoA carboxylase/reductase